MSGIIAFAVLILDAPVAFVASRSGALVLRGFSRHGFRQRSCGWPRYSLGHSSESRSGCEFCRSRCEFCRRFRRCSWNRRIDLFAEAQDYMNLSFHGVESLSFFTATGRLCGWQGKMSRFPQNVMIWTVVVVWLWANTMAAYNKRFRVFFRVSRGGVSFPSTMHHNQAARDTLPNSITQSSCRCISIWTHLQIDIVLQGGFRLRAFSDPFREFNSGRLRCLK